MTMMMMTKMFLDVVKGKIVVVVVEIQKQSSINVAVVDVVVDVVDVVVQDAAEPAVGRQGVAGLPPSRHWKDRSQREEVSTTEHGLVRRGPWRRPVPNRFSHELAGDPALRRGFRCPPCRSPGPTLKPSSYPR